jgi:NAD(P)-dependent dehydrogenase (short-subunit alcohol dehydrogenase family)
VAEHTAPHGGTVYAGLGVARTLVTGGNSGIGLATVRALLDQGGSVSAADVHVDALERLRTEQHLGRLDVARVDTTDEAALQRWVDGVVTLWGSPTGLVVSAGIERTLGVNLTGGYLACKVAVGAMVAGRNAASVVIVGSPTGYYGLELGHHAYSASKGGLLGLGRVMANEYAPLGIRVNVIWPGVIDTPLNDFIAEDAANLEAELARIPQRRMGQAHEIAAMARFLLSDEASYCTGAVFTVDGGLTSI